MIAKTTRFFARLIPLAIYTLAIGTPGWAEETRTISTSGESTVYVLPDEAVLTFGVSTVKPDLASAKVENDSVSTSLTAAIKSLGIPPQYFATDNVSVSLRHSSYNSDYITISGYLVSRTYMITLKDLKQLQTTVDTVLTNGANIFDGVSFRSTDLRKHRDTARSMAVKAAKEKAVALAADLECTVGSPRTITESGSFWSPSYSRRGDYSNITQNSVQEAPAAGGGGEEGSMPLGQMGVKASVSVTFDLVPKPE